jgi:hypothetical protein
MVEKAKVLEFLQRRERELVNQTHLPPPKSETGLFFGVYPLSREDGVLMSRPMFELILIHLSKGDLDAKSIGVMLTEATGIEAPSPT